MRDGKCFLTHQKRSTWEDNSPLPFVDEHDFWRILFRLGSQLILADTSGSKHRVQRRESENRGVDVF
jgi:hypothetical protein